jgi:hypothetical protein
MSNTFRRPMFRKGGEVGGGITSGMRNLYANGTDEKPSERIKAVLDEYSAPAVDPIAQLLIQGGLRGMSQTGGGGTLGNLAMAFEQPTQNLFKNLSAQRKEKRDIALEGVIADIDQEQADEANRIKKEIARLEDERVRSEGDANRQNKIDQQILKNKNALEQIEKKAELKVGKEFRTEQVRPAFENVVAGLTETYAESKNPAVKERPDLTAFNITKFRREAKPEVLAKYRGFKPYTFDNKGKILALPLDQYKPGDIIYDPVTTDFLIFDNAGGTYRLDPLTFEIQE